MSNEQSEHPSAGARHSPETQAEGESPPVELGGQADDDQPNDHDHKTDDDHTTHDAAAVDTEADDTDRPPSDGDDGADAPAASLFSSENSERLRGQWDSAQTAFVDDPRAAVERADRLVVETIQILSTSFTEERSRLEEQWARGESVSTEDLRIALQRYRSFFERLLSN